MVQLTRPKQYNWSVTYSHEDKNPFGTSALDVLLESISRKAIHSYKTLYELKDSLKIQRPLFILASSFNAEKEDTKVLLNYLNKGGTALIVADYFSGALADSLGISCYDNLFKDKALFLRDDTATLHFVNPHFDTLKSFPYRRDNIHNYFGKIDSVKASVIAKNEIGQPVMVHIGYGSGNLYLACTPMVFTNIHLLSKENHEFASNLLSFLPAKEMLRTQYYHLGRLEATTPLRFILTNPSLRWAYYISLTAILLFIVFEAKRRQRIIPIIKPLANTTLEFATTIGNLYFQKGDHKNMAEKKIAFFFDQVRNYYFLNPHHHSEGFADILSKKSGHPIDQVKKLLQQINYINTSSTITADSLTSLNKSIEQFWKKK
jgi:hypothetical protein